ncbi:hypothetical protein TWF569_008325 [Orbilia oligospora]|uniref:Uncharacterized protein n=1 Tax=Orbilia oligospora TaxID=2813651 RepID=A0A7C8JGE6_ORBOL|nr:hypothetical protein TWF706_006993 [Orbilia oligospora]KAF3112080.1 hypothetical protein TWF102_005824 [Orbilia oligospora]KAF3113313.1 hypothetical protein TWF103_002475 [Orbilia oligospora]KAF3140185.1 hypothetical protein TWF569_008325 [Orbilia oligospora]KAF3147405.1 hypothetical protein TWF594_002626 [Orbilia oligospora]
MKQLGPTTPNIKYPRSLVITHTNDRSLGSVTFPSQGTWQDSTRGMHRQQLQEWVQPANMGHEGLFAMHTRVQSDKTAKTTKLTSSESAATSKTTTHAACCWPLWFIFDSLSFFFSLFGKLPQQNSQSPHF